MGSTLDHAKQSDVSFVVREGVGLGLCLTVVATGVRTVIAMATGRPKGSSTLRFAALAAVGLSTAGTAYVAAVVHLGQRDERLADYAGDAEPD